MATVKVSALPSEAVLGGSEEILINDGGTSKKSTVSAVRTGSYTLPEATTTVRGGVELFSDTDQSVAATAVSTTAARTYGLQLNSDGQGVINIPWVDTDTTYSAATASALGLVKLEDDTEQSVAANAVSATASKTYGIQLNSSDQAVVNVPWTDTDTTYSAATSSALGLIKLEDDATQTTAASAITTTAARTYGLQINGSGQGVVNVPWTDTSGSNVTANGLWEHGATIGTNYTMASGNNAISAGPITIDTGVSVTVTGSWVIA